MSIRRYGLAALVGVVPLILSMSALADYLAVGPFSGEECTNYVVFDKCETHSVDAVEGEDGRLYTLQTRYPEVSRHWARKNGTGMCRINLKAQRRVGFWDDAANMLFGGPDFYTKTSSGGYEKVDVEYIMFECRKTR